MPEIIVLTKFYTCTVLGTSAGQKSEELLYTDCKCFQVYIMKSSVYVCKGLLHGLAIRVVPIALLHICEIGLQRA